MVWDILSWSDPDACGQIYCHGVIRIARGEIYCYEVIPIAWSHMFIVTSCLIGWDHTQHDLRMHVERNRCVARINVMSQCGIYPPPPPPPPPPPQLQWGDVNFIGSQITSNSTVCSTVLTLLMKYPKRRNTGLLWGTTGEHEIVWNKCRTYRCLNDKLWYLQHNCVGDTIVYH